MNNDLISREALKKSIEEYKYCGFYDKLIELIDNAPTVKPYCYFCGQKEHGQTVERPQGEWIRTGSLGNGNARYECSNCHRSDVQAESQEVPYCWHCGAHMRKGGANNG